jgi:hypothetical protein
MAVKTLDLCKELYIKGILIENANRILWIHRSGEPIARIANGF